MTGSPSTDLPRVSVILPVFNGASFLAEALESLLAQTMEKFEVIVIDDGSDDTSGKIAASFGARDSRVRIVTNETNRGVAGALNRGCGLASGPYIAIAHSDDVVVPERLARQVAFLDAHPPVAAVGSAITYMDASGRPGPVVRYPTASGAIRSLLPSRNCLAHPSVMIRRAALEEVGGYRLDLMEDYDLWLRLSERFDLANLPEPLVGYRLHPDQLSVLRLREVVTRQLVVCAAAEARRAGKDDPLDNSPELSPQLLERLGIHQRQIERAFAQSCLAWAAIVSDLGYDEVSKAFVDRASQVIGRRANKAFSAAKELKHAETLLESGRPACGAAYVARAFLNEPRYASERLAAWVSGRRGQDDLAGLGHHAANHPGNSRDVVRSAHIEWTRARLVAKRALTRSGQLPAATRLGALASPGISPPEGRGLPVACVVFSKDRPMQLDACLRSIAKFAPYSGPTVVIYKATTSAFAAGYRLLETNSPARFVAEGDDFRRDVLAACDQGHAYTVFHTDDDVFFRHPPFAPSLPDGFAAFSLRLGENTTYCYPLARDQDVPAGLLPGQLLVWNWPHADGDFAYPLSLDGHILHTGMLLRLLARARFTNPNELEDQLHIRRHLAPSPMLAYRNSCIVSLPLNIVSATRENRAAVEPEWSAGSLNSRFLAGERIDLESMDFSSVRGAHQEIPLAFEAASVRR